jgi:hypothetical protein
VSQSVIQSVSPSVSQSVSQSVSKSFSQSVSNFTLCIVIGKAICRTVPNRQHNCSRQSHIPIQHSTVSLESGGYFAETTHVPNSDRKTGRCHGEAARSVLAKVWGDVFARLHAVAAKRRSRTRNSQFGLLGTLLRATTTAV